MEMQTRSAAAAQMIKVETISRESFAPFGDLLTHEGIHPLQTKLYGDRISTYRAANFDSDQPVEFLITKSLIREYRLIYLERHLELTQSFIPLAGHPFIIAVARPNAPEEDGIPRVDEIRAFSVPGWMGINIHRGTWHEVPFPLVDNALMIVTSHRSLTRGLESTPDQKREIHKLDVEKRNVTERSGRIIRLEYS
jgi:ureidoglycolate lyase